LQTKAMVRGAMKKIFFCFLILFIIISYAKTLECPVRFAVIGDRTGDAQPGIYEEIIAEIERLKPDFVITVGDMIQGYAQDTTQLTPMWTEYKSIVAPLTMPIYFTPGNHDITIDAAAPWYKNHIAKPYYSFDYDDCHFVALHTDYYKRPGSVRLNWVADNLESTKKEHIFVFGHDPAYPVGPHVGSSLDRDSATREKFWALLVKYNVNAYICGHEHLFNKKCIDGVYQIVNCASGGDIRNGYGGAFHGYMVVKVDGKKVEVIMKDENGTEKDRFFISGR